MENQKIHLLQDAIDQLEAGSERYIYDIYGMQEE